MELETRVGGVLLKSPILTASGTSGYGAELSAYGNLAVLGGVVVKSLSLEPHPGNPVPRVYPLKLGMLNSVGLQGPGLKYWIDNFLPDLIDENASIVLSIWAKKIEEFYQCALLIKEIESEILAVEINLSCPNVEDKDKLFAHDSVATKEAVSALGLVSRPIWAKLSPNVLDILPIAGAAIDAGAGALVVFNTLYGMALDLKTMKPAVAKKIGGISGPLLHPVSVRGVYEIRQAFKDIGIIGVGGVDSGQAAVELLLAGADAVGVGTAIFSDPRAPWNIQEQIKNWCKERNIFSIKELKESFNDT
jgi:dihydroorotate dehydrogenase (NAD+) catalytic subunit